MKFIVTVGRRGTVRLSKPGWWGGMPYPDVDEAERAARELGATVVEYERGR